MLLHELAQDLVLAPDLGLKRVDTLLGLIGLGLPVAFEGGFPILEQLLLPLVELSRLGSSPRKMSQWR